MLDDKLSVCIHTGHMHGASTSITIIIIDLKQRNTPQYIMCSAGGKLL